MWQTYKMNLRVFRMGMVTFLLHLFVLFGSYILLGIRIQFYTYPTWMQCCQIEAIA